MCSTLFALLVSIFSSLTVFLKIVLRFSIELLNLIDFFKIVNLHINDARYFVIILQGGMSNEMYNTIARVTDGIYEGTVHGTSLVFFFGLFEITFDQFLFCTGIAIGGDVFPGSTLSDHILRFNNIPQVF